MAMRPWPAETLPVSITLTLPWVAVRAAAVCAAAHVPLTRLVRLIEITALWCEPRNSNCRRKSPGGGWDVLGGSVPRSISA